MKQNNIPPELSRAIQDFYEPAGFNVTALPIAEIESSEYSAYRFALNNRNIVFRVAKTTPTKPGQFVTLWKRPTPTSVIAPFDSSDDISFVIIHVFNKTHQGQFIFNKNILIEKGIFSKNGKGGKRATRVYPPWVKTIAKDAIKTQTWQMNYFISFDEKPDFIKAALFLKFNHIAIQ